jgi:threonyl-tRNA synthetase
MFNRLTNFLRAQYEHFGFQEVITPTIYKKSLWEKSGHWENYAEDMYSVTGRGASGEQEDGQLGQDEEYGLKPMNCPGHCLLFASTQRSYRDLPIRYADFSPLHRNEISGALSGLTRVRRFHQDDGHIFCRPSQIHEEISRTLDFVKLTYKVLGLGPYRLALSTRPKGQFIGTIEEWDNAEEALKRSLDESGLEWTLNEGDGAFYGPKIDIILKDSDGKEHQTATIQLDFQLPKRFELEYQAPAPELEQKGTISKEIHQNQGPVTPVLIHRAVLGSVERIMALLIEHYHSRWPFWLNPRQVIILTVNDEEHIVDFARHAARVISVYDTQYSLKDFSKKEIKASHFHGPSILVDVDDSARPLGKKISEAKRKRYGVIAIVGKDNFNSKNLTVDVSGIPDHHDLVRNDEILRSEVARGKELKGPAKTEAPGESKHLPPGGTVEQPGSQAEMESTREPDTPKSSIPPILEAGELKKINISPLKLREVLTSLEEVFV